METSEILTVGDELLEGYRTNTNAAWLAEKLTELGVDVRRITTVRDSVNEISKAVKEALKRNPDLLIVTGGLGPTPDDKTLESIAKAIGANLTLNKQALEFVKENYSRMQSQGIVEKKELTKPREKMAYLPRGARPLPNPVGAAPGVHLEPDETHLICLPGVPKEMHAIFKEYVQDMLVGMGGRKKFTETITVEEGDESVIAPLIKDLTREFPEVEVRSYPSENVVRIVITSPSPEKSRSAKKTLSELLRESS